MQKTVYLAPAKVNLFLRVTGKRQDGYHTLQTLFQRIDLADELEFEPAERLTLACDRPELLGEDNLVLRAARRLQSETGTRLGARIKLTKRIPVAAGLGGGSSDAATTLQALNRLWKLELSREALVVIARKLGADVPFFLYDSAYALGEGVGDECRVIEEGPELHGLLVNPGSPLSTQEVFSEYKLNLTLPSPSVSLLENLLCNGSLAELAQGIINDLQPEAIRRCPVISDIQLRLQQSGCLVSCVSGSGPTVFGLTDSRAAAQKVVDGLQDTSWFCAAFSTLRQRIFPV